MKKILFLLQFVFYSLSISGQINFSYSKYFNGYWDDNWENSYSYLMKGTYNYFVIYHQGVVGRPADYIARIHVKYFNQNVDKKEKRERLKKEKWYEYTGVIECFFDSYITSEEKWLRRFPYVPDANSKNAKKHTMTVNVKIAPYRKNPMTYNFFLKDNLGLGITLK